jgi:hypothetical protein
MIPNRRSAQQKVADFSDKIMLQNEANFEITTQGRSAGGSDANP